MKLLFIIIKNILQSKSGKGNIVRFHKGIQISYENDKTYSEHILTSVSRDLLEKTIRCHLIHHQFGEAIKCSEFV